MKPEDQNIAIAEWVGWKEVMYRHQSFASCATTGIDPLEPSNSVGMKVYKQIPNYHGDLNAIHECENKLRGSAIWSEYKRRLSIICSTGFEFPVDATASQRCEALLRTLNLWKESPST